MNERIAEPNLGAIWLAFTEIVPLMLGTHRYGAAWEVAVLEAAGRDLLDTGVWVSANNEVRSGDGVAWPISGDQPPFVLHTLHLHGYVGEGI